MTAASDKVGLAYKSPLGYELLMRLLYGRAYNARYQMIDPMVAEGETVLDLCCGPGTLYNQYLRKRNIDYLGADINEGLLRHLANHGAKTIQVDLQQENIEQILPRRHVVIMQGSLYHFLPDPSKMIAMMFRLAQHKVIIAEPVRNLTTSWPKLATFANKLSHAGTRSSPLRFTAQTLEQWLHPYANHLQQCVQLPGGREVVYLFTVGET